MNLPYPFDPTDWSTITPRFTALNEQPVPRESVMAWLDAWNQLDIDL